MQVVRPSGLILRVLGGFEVRSVDGKDLAPIGVKLRGLIACLALRSGVAWSREQLADLLWSDRAEQQGRGSLRQALSDLRRSLGPSALLSVERNCVALDPAAVTVDAIEFERLAKAGELQRAVELYRGDLLDGLNLNATGFQDWLLVERTKFHDLALDVLARLLAVQEGETGISVAQRLLKLEPCYEEAHRWVMRFYASSGHRAQAVRQYQICRDALQRDLATLPDAETERLYCEIRQRVSLRRVVQAANANDPSPAMQPISPIAARPIADASRAQVSDQSGPGSGGGQFVDFDSCDQIHIPLPHELREGRQDQDNILRVPVEVRPIYSFTDLRRRYGSVHSAHSEFAPMAAQYGQSYWRDILIRASTGLGAVLVIIVLLMAQGSS